MEILHLAAFLLSIFEVDILVSFHFVNEFPIGQVKSVLARGGSARGDNSRPNKSNMFGSLNK